MFLYVDVRNEVASLNKTFRPFFHVHNDINQYLYFFYTPLPIPTRKNVTSLYMPVTKINKQDQKQNKKTKQNNNNNNKKPNKNNNNKQTNKI